MSLVRVGNIFLAPDMIQLAYWVPGSPTEVTLKVVFLGGNCELFHGERAWSLYEHLQLNTTHVLAGGGKEGKVAKV